MKRLLVLAFVVGILSASSASAQILAPSLGQSPFGRGGATLSPYLNLRRGGNPAANYFLGVVPEIDRRATAAQQGAAIQDLERREALGASAVDPLSAGRPTALPPTGHPTAFNSLAGYFGQTTPAALPRPQSRGR